MVRRFGVLAADLRQAPFESSIEPAGWLLCRAHRHECARKMGLVPAQCRFDECQPDHIALGETAAAPMRNMKHVSQPFDAPSIFATSKGE
jgi:hypothetical protein